MQFEFMEDDSHSKEVVEKEDDEPKFHTLVLRRSTREIREPKRYNPLEFCSSFYFMCY